MRSALAAVLCLCLAPLATPRSASAASLDPYLDALALGVQRAEQSQFELAEREFAAAARLDPDDALGYVGQGLCELAAGRVNQAAALFRCAIETHRADAVAQAGLGVCQLEVGAIGPAASFFDQAAQADPLLIAPAFYRAVIELARDRLDEAPRYLDRARQLGAPDAALDYLDALRLLAAGRLEASSDRLRRLRPKLDSSLPGLPTALPLRHEPRDGGGVRLRIPLGEPLDERVAARAPRPVVERRQAEIGSLLVEAPTPGETVSGRLPVRVRLREAHRYQYVTVSIDGRMRGMTNRAPFYVVWDTSGYPDGPHTVTVKAIGETELETSFEVTVGNQAQPSRNPHDKVRHESYGRRVAALLIHSVPATAVETLLTAAYRQQDPEKALELCERVLAEDESRSDVVQQLLDLYRNQGLAFDPAKIAEPHHGVPGARRVALTFDDGPRPEYTPPLLEQLARYRARSTFLVTGRMSERYPEMVRAIAAGGHEIGSHTYNHLRLDTLTQDEVVYELVKCKVVLDSILGGSSRFFRPPGGHYNPQIRRTVAALGYFPVFWTINCGDFQNLAGPVAAEAVMRRVNDGAILLLHNGPDNTLAMLPYLLQRLGAAGYRMVTLSNILRAPAEATLVEGYDQGPLSTEHLRSYAGTE